MFLYSESILDFEKKGIEEEVNRIRRTANKIIIKGGEIIVDNQYYHFHQIFSPIMAIIVIRKGEK